MKQEELKELKEQYCTFFNIWRSCLTEIDRLNTEKVNVPNDTKNGIEALTKFMAILNKIERTKRLQIEMELNMQTLSFQMQNAKIEFSNGIYTRPKQVVDSYKPHVHQYADEAIWISSDRFGTFIVRKCGICGYLERRYLKEEEISQPIPQK